MSLQIVDVVVYQALSPVSTRFVCSGYGLTVPHGAASTVAALQLKTGFSSVVPLFLAVNTK